MYQSLRYALYICRILSKLSVIESREIKVLRQRIITLIVFVILFGVCLCKLFSFLVVHQEIALSNIFLKIFMQHFIFFPFLFPIFVTRLSSGFKHIKHQNWLLAGNIEKSSNKKSHFASQAPQSIFTHFSCQKVKGKLRYTISTVFSSKYEKIETV